MQAGAHPAIGQQISVQAELGAEDLEIFGALSTLVENHFEEIVSNFDHNVQAAPREAHSPEASPGVLKQRFGEWLRSLFSKERGAEHPINAGLFGRACAEQGVPRAYVAGVLFLLQNNLFTLLDTIKELDIPKTRRAITNVLVFELIIMLDAYCAACIPAIEHKKLQEKFELSQELAESERAEQLTIEQAKDLIVSLDGEGRILTFNRTAEQLTGLSREHAAGQSFLVLMDESIRSNVQKILQEEILNKSSRHGVVETVIAKAGGQKCHMRWHFMAPAMRIFRHAAVVAVGHDVTEQKVLAEKARKAERLAAVGTLAHGLAHEIRNPLNGARLHLTFAERAMKKLPAAAEVSDALSVVKDEINRLALLVDDFSEFARPIALETGPRNLLAICEDSVNENRERAAKAKAHLRTELNEPDLLVEADTDKVRQALNNLVQNAIEAVAPLQGGSVIVRARKHNAHEAIVEVEDDGIGLTSSDAPVFDAFYSTKTGGTGLGLAIVHRIVSDHGGSVGVECLPGRTIFWMTLPLSEEASGARS